MNSQGPETAEILVVAEHPSFNDATSGELLSDYAGTMLFNALSDFNIKRHEVRIELLHDQQLANFDQLTSHERAAGSAKLQSRLRDLKPNVIIAVGENALRTVTAKVGIHKHHMSILHGIYNLKVVPVLHPKYVLSKYKESVFLRAGIQRAVEESKDRAFSLPRREFILDPSLPEALAYLDDFRKSDWLSVDIETAGGQITCVGIGDSPLKAVSIDTRTKSYTPADFHLLWTWIEKCLCGPSKKVFQNGVYDISYFSRYGISVKNYAFDTIFAQQFLYPELRKGLDTIARMFSREPYWKDDAKDWGARQDFHQLMSYNCKDVCVTLECAFAQISQLRTRNLEEPFNRLMMSMAWPSIEMSHRGLKVDETERTKLKQTTDASISEERQSLRRAIQPIIGVDAAANFNEQSSKQKIELIRAAGIRVPKKRGSGRETTDVGALKQLAIKHPEQTFFAQLLKLSELNKEISSYLTYSFDRDGQVRYSFSPAGPVTGRWRCGLDPWGSGFNAQTIPGKMKSQFIAPDGYTFLEIDLRQADGRFVAWDANEHTMMQMFNDGVDVHRYVASRPQLFNKPEAEITKLERQLGKKSGHSANYGTGAVTLAASCLKEMDHVISCEDAQEMLDGYMFTFPQIARWHHSIEEQLSRTRCLSTPMGRQRYFYDRIGPDMYREAYAYRPQSTVSDTINCLVRHLRGHSFLLLQGHDSVLVAVLDRELRSTITRIKDESAWNPVHELRGGTLRIPIDIEIGKRLSMMEKIA